MLLANSDTMNILDVFWQNSIYTFLLGVHFREEYLGHRFCSALIDTTRQISQMIVATDTLTSSK